MRPGESIAGQALARALQERYGAQVGPEQGRALLLALIRLHALGALAFDLAPTRPGRESPDSQPNTTAQAVVGSGTPGLASGGQTPDAYNIGSLFASERDSK